MAHPMVNLREMLSKDFVMLVIISLFISMPVAYYFMSSFHSFQTSNEITPPNPLCPNFYIESLRLNVQF